MDFKQRLQKATQRGQQTRDQRRREETAKALSEEECRRMHTSLRLELNEHIEACLRQLADNFPGFQFQTVVKDRGWGAAVSRDDVAFGGGSGRRNVFSRLEIVVRPFNEFHVLELATKGTVRNKEFLTRNHFEHLGEADLDSFKEMVDLWTLEFAEQYASES
jgi:hypothetical protein